MNLALTLTPAPHLTLALALPRSGAPGPVQFAGSTADEITISLAHEQAALRGGATGGGGGPPPPSDSTDEPPLRKQRRAARPRLPRALQGAVVCARAGEVPCGDSDPDPNPH